MMKYAIITICFIFAVNITEVTSSSYMHGFSIGMLKNRMSKEKIMRKKYEEMNRGVCSEPNPRHNPFKIVYTKDPTKCYSREKPQNPIIGFTIVLLSLACLVFVLSDPDNLDFIVGMAVADILEGLFEN